MWAMKHIKFVCMIWHLTLESTWKYEILWRIRFQVYRFPFIRTRRISYHICGIDNGIVFAYLRSPYSFRFLSFPFLSPLSLFLHYRYTCALVKRPFGNSVYAVDFILILWDFIERTKTTIDELIAFLKDNLVLFESIPKYKVSFVCHPLLEFYYTETNTWPGRRQQQQHIERMAYGYAFESTFTSEKRLMKNVYYNRIESTIKLLNYLFVNKIFYFYIALIGRLIVHCVLLYMYVHSYKILTFCNFCFCFFFPF